MRASEELRAAAGLMRWFGVAWGSPERSGRGAGLCMMEALAIVQNVVAQKVVEGGGSWQGDWVYAKVHPILRARALEWLRDSGNVADPSGASFMTCACMNDLAQTERRPAASERIAMMHGIFFELPGTVITVERSVPLIDLPNFLDTVALEIDWIEAIGDENKARDLGQAAIAQISQYPDERLPQQARSQASWRAKAADVARANKGLARTS